MEYSPLGLPGPVPPAAGREGGVLVREDSLVLSDDVKQVHSAQLNHLHDVVVGWGEGEGEGRGRGERGGERKGKEQEWEARGQRTQGRGCCSTMSLSHPIHTASTHFFLTDLT